MIHNTVPSVDPRLSHDVCLPIRWLRSLITKRVVETTLGILRNYFLLQGSFGMGQMTSYIVMCTAHYLYILCDALIVMANIA